MAPPQICLEDCRVNSCRLSKYYDGKDEEARAAEELNCVEVNASEARYCARIKLECRKALTAEH
jgi:hypothetical protein